MRALYFLISRARTVYALGQAIVTFARAGPSALMPVQLLVLGCGLCLIIGILVPSPPPAGGRRAILMDRLGSVTAAVAAIGLTVSDTLGSFVLLDKLTLGV